LYFPYKEIVINGYDLYREKGVSNSRKAKYYTTTEENKIIKDIYFLEGIPNDESYVTNGFIGLEINVNGKKFVRSCENYFILEGMKDELLIEFFDSIASCYDVIVDKELNKKVSKIIFNEIRKNLKNAYSSKYIKMLDYGIGTGISYEVYKEINLPEKYELYGCDLSEKMLEQCKHKGFFYVSPVGYAKTGFDENYFDAIFSIFVVHYFYNNAPYKEIKRILKPNGIFIFNTKPYKAKNEKDEKLIYMRRNDDVWNELSFIFKSVKRYEFIIKTSEKTRIIPIYICRKNGFKILTS